jgi:putative endonuclease
MFTLYGIKSSKTGRIYIGQTDNVERRLSDHNSGRVFSTKRDTPWVVCALQTFSTREAARWGEFQIKKSLGRRQRWLRNNAMS